MEYDDRLIFATFVEKQDCAEDSVIPTSDNFLTVSDNVISISVSDSEDDAVVPLAAIMVTTTPRGTKARLVCSGSPHHSSENVSAEVKAKVNEAFFPGVHPSLHIPVYVDPPQSFIPPSSVYPVLGEVVSPAGVESIHSAVSGCSPVLDILHFPQQGFEVDTGSTLCSLKSESVTRTPSPPSNKIPSIQERC